MSDDSDFRGGELLPLRQNANDDDLKLEAARLEPLTASEEAAAVDLLAAAFRGRERSRSSRARRVA